MALVTSLGSASGLPLATLLSSITASENAPLTAMTQQQTAYNTKLSAYGTVQSALSTLQTAAAQLGNPTLFQNITSTSSATNVLSATASTSASAGSFAVNVGQLAQAQSLASAGVASTTAGIGSGTVTINFGSITGGTLDPVTGKYTGATFTADSSRQPTTITIDSSNNTLSGIRDAINKNSALGVTATIVNDGSSTPNRLVLTSNQTGASSTMRISVSGDAALSNLLSNDPAGTQNLQQTVVGQDAKLTVNGIAVTSSSNTVKEAVQGVTMTLTGTGASTLSLQSNTATVQAAITNFVTAYNSLQSLSKQLTAFDTTAQTQAPLTGDSTLRNIQTRIRDALNTPQPASGTGAPLTMLAQIGVAFQADGTMAVDATKLSAALSSNLSGVQNLFSSASGTTGFGSQMSTLITSFTATNGPLKAATDGLNTTLKTLATQMTSTQALISTTIARYTTQFTQLDTLIAGMNQTSSYLTQQFAAINGTSSK
ncbi:flagellar hook-associated protein 2 [Collimonas arenae]|uniref:Flagellar hook-associated protein 2 n=1 Tax=Collimonas arenae TaxID=279058 RepID=A0A127PM43_9BURK|nr:flagellar filament capping protein FliD [Collimonas arenae]AMO98860.1 flagellar hook-associated protein 2 [Collimonas arenae]AMP08756.1 flagellar hook-associated protein 2 [Collimonas arenae]